MKAISILLIMFLTISAYCQNLHKVPDHYNYISAFKNQNQNIQKQMEAYPDVFWLEDFSGGTLPAGWSVVDNTGNDFNWIVTEEQFSTMYLTNPVINTTSGGYFMLLPAEYYNQPYSSSPINMDTYIQTGAIDCSGKTSVLLMFQEYFRYCCSSTEVHLVVVVSNDGINWTQYDAKNGFGISTASANPVNFELDISLIAANQPTVYIRWHMYGGSHYFWMVDDIKLTELSVNDLVIDNVEANFGGYSFYSMVPKSQVVPISFKGSFHNNGSATQNNVQFDVSVNNYIDSVFNDSWLCGSPVAPDLLDSFEFSQTFTPPPVPANYQIVYHVSSDSVDNVPGDNYDTLAFAVTDSVFARDIHYTTKAGPCIYVSSSDGDFCGVNYYLNAPQEVRSLSVFIAPGSAYGSTIMGKVLKWDSSSGDWIPVVVTDLYMIKQNDIGNWITIPFIPDGVSEFLDGNTVYSVGVDCYWQAVGNLYIGGDDSGPYDYPNVTLLRLDSNYYYTNVVPIIRLNFNEFGVGSYITGKVFYDENLNEVMDTNEVVLSNAFLKFKSATNQVHYTCTDYNGKYSFPAWNGTFQISLLPKVHWKYTTDSLVNVTVGFGDTVSNINFGRTIIPNINDLSISLAGNITFCSDESIFWITYRNEGSNVQSGTVTMTIDPVIAFSQSYPVPSGINGNVVSWDFSNLQVNEERWVDLYLIAPDFNFIGDTTHSFVSIESANTDIYPENNADTLNQIVTCSYDPNDKAVSPSGILEQGFVLFGTKLTYTINFQNTGNAEAYNVNIMDTLDGDFDISTFELIASSHPVYISIDQNNIFTFHFDNIMLPDSNSNEPGSHGFVKFSILPKASLPENTVVKNTAYIYFDYNPAVITNSVNNTYVSVLPPVVSAPLINMSPKKLQLYPNPANDNITIAFSENLFERYELVITELTGRRIVKKSVASGDSYDISGLSDGIYIVKVSGNYDTSLIKKLVVAH